MDGGGGLPGFFPRFHDPAAGCGDGDDRDGIEARFQPKRNLFFGLSGTPFLRSGTVFQLPGIALEVEFDLDEIQTLRSYDEIRHSLEKKGKLSATPAAPML